MAIDFPTSPSVGQQYTFGGVAYTFTAQNVWAVSGVGNVSNSGTPTVNQLAQWVTATTIKGIDISSLGFLSANVSANLTVGYTTSVYGLGVLSSGSVTPNVANGHIQSYTNNGAHTLLPPSSNCTMIVDITNGATAGIITVTSFTKVDGDLLDTVNAHAFRCYISNGPIGSHMNIKRMF